MSSPSDTVAMLSRLEPVCRLSASGIREIAGACSRSRMPRGASVVPERPGESVYLVKGELLVSLPDGSSEVVVGGADAALQPLFNRACGFVAARAITDIELLGIDDDVLDVLLTWDQMSVPATGEPRAKAADWRTLSGIYAAQHLTRGIFAALPPANIEALLSRFERVAVRRGDIVLRQGEPGEHYYVIERGRAEVTRVVGGAKVTLAGLRSGEGFGEEALLAEAPRNATVTMRSDGVLLRLGTEDFAALLREPLLHRVGFADAQARAASGAVWVDVRFPVEFHLDRVPGAINLPLNEIRNALAALDPAKEYIAYCQSGRRSSVAAFLMSRHGLRASLLDGGLRRWVRERANVDPEP